MKKERSRFSFLRTFRYENIKQWRDSSSALALWFAFLFALGLLFAFAYFKARGTFWTGNLYLDETETTELRLALQNLDPNSKEAAFDRLLLSQGKKACAFYGLDEASLLPSKSANLSASFAFSYLFLSLPCLLLFSLYPLYQVFLKDNVSGFSRNWGEGDLTLKEIRKGKRVYFFLFLFGVEIFLFLMGMVLIPGGECAYYDGQNYVIIPIFKVYLLSLFEMLVCSLAPVFLVSFLFNERETRKSFSLKVFFVVFLAAVGLVAVRVQISLANVPYLGAKALSAPNVYWKRILIEGLIDAGTLLLGIGLSLRPKKKFKKRGER